MLRIPARFDLRRQPLTTPRLTLTPMEPPDTHELWVAVDGSRVHLEPWLPWVPYQTDTAASARYVEASTGDWDYGRALRLTVRERLSRAFLGVVSLESLQHLHLSGDLGYWIRKEASGHGLMTEATQAVLTWAFHDMGIHRIQVAAATDNYRSLGVIGRLGFRFEGIGRHAERIAGRWLDHAIFAKLSTD